MENLYVKKTASKANLCFICSKFTSTVLRTQVDFFYVCENHLSDLSFCKVIYEKEESIENPVQSKEDSKISESKETQNQETQSQDGFMSNLQKALFSQMSFSKTVEKSLQVIKGYELNSAFVFSRFQVLEKKRLVKQNSLKNQEIISYIEEWPKVPDTELKPVGEDGKDRKDVSNSKRL